MAWLLCNRHLWLLDVLRERLDFPSLKRAVRERAKMFHPQTILIEDKGSGSSLIQELRHEGMYAVKAYLPKHDKETRFHAICGMVEGGFVHVPEKAPWFRAYLHELSTFPKAKYDDQADSTSQALDWFKQRYFGPRVWIGEFLV